MQRTEWIPKAAPSLEHRRVQFQVWALDLALVSKPTPRQDADQSTDTSEHTSEETSEETSEQTSEQTSEEQTLEEQKLEELTSDEELEKDGQVSRACMTCMEGYHVRACMRSMFTLADIHVLDLEQTVSKSTFSNILIKHSSF
jgi:hypothetical protein